jgi:hypothetical protein
MNKPASVTIRPWLNINLGPRCLAPLTGTDSRALRAAVEIIELYSYDRHLSLIHAFGAVVSRMQPQCREFAYHGIAHVMDWSDRPKIWAAAGLPPIIASRCSHEPQGVPRLIGGPI